MGDDITIGVTEIVNNIEVTAQPSDQIIDIDVVDNSDDVTLNITPTVIEININKGSSFARWGTILGNLPDQADLQNVLNLKADLVGGLVPASQLPSYVDDIVEVANYAALPVVGETGKIYLTLDNNKIFRWSGSVYIEIAANNAIWGAITGTLSSQTDLQTALDTKALKTITITPNAPLSGGGDLSANRTVSISQSNATTDGYLSSTDWNTFNGKQPALSGTGFVKISGSTISYDNSTYALDSVVVKLTGDQTITGTKTFSNTTAGVGIYSSNSSSGDGVFIANSSTGRAIALTNTSTGYGIFTSNTSTGYGIISNNTLTGVAALFNNTSSGKNLILNNTSTGTGMPFSVQKSNIDVATISDAGAGVFSSTVQASAFKLTGMTAGSGALYWSSDRVTLANYNTNGVVEIEALGGNSIATFGNSIDFTKTVFVSSNLYANGLVSRGTPANTLSYLSGSGAIFIRSLADETAYAFQLNTSSGLDLWSTNSGGTSTRRVTLDSSGNVLINNSDSRLYGGDNVGRFIIGNPSVTTYLAMYGNSHATVPHLAQFVVNSLPVLNMTSGGNVGIGTTSPTTKLQVSGGNFTISDTTSPRSIVSGNTSNGFPGYMLSNTTQEYEIIVRGNLSNSFQIRNSTASTDLMTITSGGVVCIGTTSAFDSGIVCSDGGTSYVPYTAKIGTTASSTQMFFRNPNGVVGSISTSGSLTSFNVTSDYRLKQDFKPFNGLDLVSKIKVYDYAWKVDNSRMNGVIAHELQEVISYAVTGKKDAEQMQSVDYSKLVPILIQAIQELNDKINKLENK